MTAGLLGPPILAGQHADQAGSKAIEPRRPHLYYPGVSRELPGLLPADAELLIRDVLPGRAVTSCVQRTGGQLSLRAMLTAG